MSLILYGLDFICARENLAWRLFLDAELVYSENSEQVLLNGVYFSVQKSIEFVCQYSLADQSVEADFNIAGKDMEFARAARGQLHYTLVPTTETVIGDDHHFDIIPATPGVIYSRYRTLWPKTVRFYLEGV